MQCTDAPPCHRDGDVIRADWSPSTVGSYQPAVLVARESLLAATGNFDRDLAAALEAGVIVEMGPEIEVR